MACGQSPRLRPCPRKLSGEPRAKFERSKSSIFVLAFGPRRRKPANGSANGAPQTRLDPAYRSRALSRRLQRRLHLVLRFDISGAKSNIVSTALVRLASPEFIKSFDFRSCLEERAKSVSSFARTARRQRWEQVICRLFFGATLLSNQVIRHIRVLFDSKIDCSAAKDMTCAGHSKSS